MKNFIYISLLSFGLIVSSCTKEKVLINNSTELEVPTWGDDSPEKSMVSTSTSNEGNGQTTPTNEANANDGTGAGDLDDGSTLDGDITDPNNDPDGKKKKL